MTASLDRRSLLAATSALIVSGCADLVGPPPAPKLFRLKPALTAGTGGPRRPVSLCLQMPGAGADLDSQRIAITRPPAGLDYYADAAWADRLPALVQGSLVEAFEMSGGFAAVTRDSDGARGDLILNSDVRDFEADYDQGEGAPLAVVRLGVRLLRSQSRQVVGSTVLSQSRRASANSVVAAVTALDAALSALLAELVGWVAAQKLD